MNTSQAAEMETGKPDEVSSSKPEEQVTEKYESPMLMERRTEDVYDGESKRTEITVGTHLSAEKVNLRTSKKFMCSSISTFCLMFRIIGSRWTEV